MPGTRREAYDLCLVAERGFRWPRSTPAYRGYAVSTPLCLHLLAYEKDWRRPCARGPGIGDSNPAAQGYFCAGRFVLASPPHRRGAPGTASPNLPWTQPG